MRTLTARKAAARYKVKRTTVLRWHSRGWLDPTGERQYLTLIGHNEDGARLFDEAELVIAEQQTRAKAQRSHRRSRKLVAA